MADQEKINQKIREVLDLCGKEKHIFRGENKIYPKVSSNLYRRYYELIKSIKNTSYGKNVSPVLEIEKDIVDRAKYHIRPDAPNIEVLTELQHHGGKTALIDFTRNLYIALFFACNGNFEEDGRIILFTELETSGQPNIDYEAGNEYAIVLPTGKSPRVVFQSSIFVHAAKGYLEEDKYETITIEKELKKPFLDYLRRYHDIEAKTIYNDIQGFIQNQGDYPDAEENLFLGIIYHAAKQIDDAIKYYDKAIKLNPLFAEAFYNRGLAKSDLSDEEEAIKDYDKAIELNPQYAKAYNNRGVAKSNLGDKEEAIKDYDKAIELNPKYAKAYNNRGLAKSNLGDKEEAIKDYDKAIELNPKYAEAYNNRGDANHSLERFEQAIRDYDEALRLNPGLLAAAINRGVVKAALRMRNKEAHQ